MFMGSPLHVKTLPAGQDGGAAAPLDAQALVSAAPCPRPAFAQSLPLVRGHPAAPCTQQPQSPHLPDPSASPPFMTCWVQPHARDGGVDGLSVRGPPPGHAAPHTQPPAPLRRHRVYGEPHCGPGPPFPSHACYKQALPGSWGCLTLSSSASIVTLSPALPLSPAPSLSLLPLSLSLCPSLPVVVVQFYDKFNIRANIRISWSTSGRCPATAGHGLQ